MEKNRELKKIKFRDIEEEMQKYNPDFRLLSVFEIAKDPNRYHLFSTLLDDHFTILLRCQNENAVKKAKEYLKKNGFLTFGNLDTFGLERVRQDYVSHKNLPENVVFEVMKKVEEYLGLDLSKEEEFGRNKEGDFYFYFYPITKEIRTWVEFKESTNLTVLNSFAKEAHQSIDMIFSQLDNVVYGGLKLPGIASKEMEEAYFEAVNVQVNSSNPRHLYIASKILTQLVQKEEELNQLGLFQMFMVEKEIFSDSEAQEIYLDFPNEVDNRFLD